MAMPDKIISASALREQLGIDPDGDCEKCRFRGMFGCRQSGDFVRACTAIDDCPAVDTLPAGWVPVKEYPLRVNWSGWKGTRDTRYYCPRCTKPVRKDDVYCHRCGQHIMFPKVSFTPYVPGEKQQEIVTWPDDDGKIVLDEFVGECKGHFVPINQAIPPKEVHANA